MTPWRCAWIVCLLAGCPWTAPIPLARVQLGPAYHESTTTLAALPVLCNADATLCTPAHAAAVANATRMTLEFAGYSVVDSELINSELRRRSTRTQEAGGGPRTVLPRNEFKPPESTTRSEGEVTSGATWAEIPPAQQHELLVAIGVEGILRTSITIGYPRGMAQQRTVTVNVDVSRLADSQLVWNSDCDVETGDFHSTEQAIDLATRCALESVTLW